MPPVIVIGVDGMPPRLLDRLISDGYMKAYGGLRNRGCAFTLRSTPNYQSASAWTSMVTGTNPGKHGILHFTNPLRSGYGCEQIDRRAVRFPSIWRLLSDAGTKVAALNVPVSFPAEAVKGVMIAGWLCPSENSEGFTWPPELAAEITSHCGSYPIHPDLRRHAERGRYDRASAVAAEGIRAKLDVARWLLRRETPDLLWVVVTELDSLQHWCWHLIDEEHPEHDPRLASRWREVILAAYRALDEQVQLLLDDAGPDADVLIVSDHGQVPNSRAQVLLRPWLVDAGYLVPQRRSPLRRGADALLGGGFEMLRSGATNRLKVRLRSRFGGLQSLAQTGVRATEADWTSTRAWTETGHIFVNLRGRQPLGIVEPGEDYEALLSDLTGGLLELRDERTGEPVVAEVTRGDAVFAGPAASMMPDLLVHWRSDLSVSKLSHVMDGRRRIVVRRRPPSLPPGAHHPDGILMVAGPSFRQCNAGEAHTVYDIAPTLLHLLGRPVPEWFDGRVMTDLLAETAAEGIGQVAVNEERQFAGDDTCSPQLQEQGKAEIERRLRSLGYLD